MNTTILKIIRVILAIIVIGMAVYSIFTQNFVGMPILMLSLSFFMLVSGFIVYSHNKRDFWIYLILAIFMFVVVLVVSFLN